MHTHAHADFLTSWLYSTHLFFFPLKWSSFYLIFFFKVLAKLCVFICTVTVQCFCFVMPRWHCCLVMSLFEVFWTWRAFQFWCFVGLNPGLAMVAKAFFPCGDKRRLFTQNLQGTDASSNDKCCTDTRSRASVCFPSFFYSVHCSRLTGCSCNRRVWSHWRWGLIQWFKL